MSAGAWASERAWAEDGGGQKGGRGGGGKSGRVREGARTSRTFPS